MSKIILDLCGGTGEWSKPYREAGYDVRIITTPEFDVTTYHPPDNVYGVLAAPPCTMFSMARSNAKIPRDLRKGMEPVFACLRVIAECQYNGSRLAFWAMENPKARLRWFLGKPAMTFQPFEFGDPHSKRTDLWGNFNTDLKRSPVKMTEEQVARSKTNSRKLPDLPNGYALPPDMTKQGARRSMTPQGFAQAFFEANK
jgi:hypothetical protein